MRYPLVHELSPEECWARLRTSVVGRLAIPGAERLELFPVNFVVDDRTVVFRTDPGTKLTASNQEAAVAFEADGFEPATNEAWSVVLNGILEPAVGASEVGEFLERPLFPWQYGEKAFVVRVIPALVSGRQFVVTDPARWASHLAGLRRAAAE